MLHDMDQGHESHLVCDSLSQNDTVGDLIGGKRVLMLRDMDWGHEAGT
jgi:hypothetical protein